MAHLYAQDIGDVALFFHRNFVENKVIDLTRDYRKWEIADEFSNRVKMVSKDSKDFRFPLMVGGYDNGQDDAFYQPDSYTRENLGLDGVSYFYMYKSGWIVDRREPGYPTGASALQIVDVFKLQRQNMFNQWFARQQRYKWTLPTAPNVGTAGAIKPNSVNYFVVQSTTRAIGANGGHPSGYSSVTGNSRTTYPQTKNYTGTYASVSHADFGAQLSEMIDKMQWVAPRAESLESMPTLDYELTSTYAPFAEYQTLATSSNTDIGADMGKYRGKVPAGSQSFRGITWNWSDTLTSQYLQDGVTANTAYDANDPVYCLDKSTWTIYAAKGFWMLEGPPVAQDSSHNTYANPFDAIYNRVCTNPRGNGVLRRYTS